MLAPGIDDTAAAGRESRYIRPMRRLLAVFVVLALGVASEAKAGVSPLRQVAIDVSLTITFRAEPCPPLPDVRACYSPSIRTVYAPAPLYRSERLHEIGHAVDQARLTDGERNRFRHYVDLPRWNSTASEPGGVEIFADAFALCILRPRITGREEFMKTGYRYGYRPRSRRDHRQICAFIMRATR